MASEQFSEVTEADLESSRKLRGLFTDRIYVQPHGDGMHMRINFGEVVGGETQYHTAIVVSSANAVEFASLIHRLAVVSINHANSLLGESNG